MTPLGPNPTFATLKRFAAEADKRFDAFVQALDLFGREPGETWHPLADEFIGRVLELKTILRQFEGKTSFPTAERREVTVRLEKIVSPLTEIQLQLRDRLIAECPPLQLPAIVDASIETVWTDYDRLKKPAPHFERTIVQRLLQRAHHPTSAVTLLSDQESIGDFTTYWNLLPMFHLLLQNTPLPRQGHQTLKALQQQYRRKHVAEGRTQPVDPSIFDRFVQDVAASDPERRKKARKELEMLRDQSNGEKRGELPVTEWEYSQTLLAVWDGVRTSLANADVHYRRAALCALPVLQFTLIVDDFAEEVTPFVLQGLQDPDGMVRYKLVRFGRDFFMVQRIDHARVADDFEKQVLSAYKRLPKEAKAIRKSFKQLLSEIKTLRQFDLRRGARPLVEANVL